MAGFILDSDPYIPTGVPATPEQVAELVVAEVLPAKAVANLAPEQQPDDLKAAVAEVIAQQISDGDATVTDFAAVMKDAGVTKTEANAAVSALKTAEPVLAEPLVAEEL